MKCKNYLPSNLTIYPINTERADNYSSLAALRGVDVYQYGLLKKPSFAILSNLDERKAKREYGDLCFTTHQISHITITFYNRSWRLI